MKKKEKREREGREAEVDKERVNDVKEGRKEETDGKQKRKLQRREERKEDGEGGSEGLDVRERAAADLQKKMVRIIHFHFSSLFIEVFGLFFDLCRIVRGRERRLLLIL